MKHDKLVDWHSVAQSYRARVTHILAVLGVIGGYALLMPAYETVGRWGLGNWSESLIFWVFVPTWLVTVGTLAMFAPRLIFLGLPTPWKDYDEHGDAQEPPSVVEQAASLVVGGAPEAAVTPSLQRLEAAAMIRLAAMVKDSPTKPSEQSIRLAAREMAKKALRELEEKERNASSTVALETRDKTGGSYSVDAS